MVFVDEMEEVEQLTGEHIVVDEFMAMIKDLRCWIKYLYAESHIPELTRIKAVRRCINLIIRVAKVCWQDYEAIEVERSHLDLTTGAGKK